MKRLVLLALLAACSSAPDIPPTTIETGSTPRLAAMARSSQTVGGPATKTTTSRTTYPTGSVNTPPGMRLMITAKIAATTIPTANPHGKPDFCIELLQSVVAATVPEV